MPFPMFRTSPWILAAIIWLAGAVGADVIVVDLLRGSDVQEGTAELPLRTLQRAAGMVNARTEPGPTTIRLLPGIYALERSVTFENRRAYGRDRPLAIEASIAPGTPGWTPDSMPAIVSIEDPRKPGGRGPTQTYGLKVKMGHVAIRGLKFLGSPLLDNWYCPLECLADDLTDVRVTGCLFAAAPGIQEIYCAVITDGHRFTVDHCVFLGCRACAVFWDGGRGVEGRGNAMHHCIVDGARIAGVWTCDTGEDFEFHHNVVARSEYFWMRKRGATRTYAVRDCLLVGNRNRSGYGVESGPTGPSGPEVTFLEEALIEEGPADIEMNPRFPNYLKVRPGTPGASLGAGLSE